MVAKRLFRHILTFAFFTSFAMNATAEEPVRRGDLDLYWLPATPPPAENTNDFYRSTASDSFGLCLDTTYVFGTFGGTDCWGYQAPDGTEYAIMGTNLGVVIVNTATRDVVDTVIGPASSCGTAMWRDLKTYKHYLYAASECTGTRAGIMIIDLATLPDSAHFVKSYVTTGQVTSHNISIDTAKGFLYAVRSGYDGFRVINLADPINPVEMPFVNTMDLHDIMAVNDTVFAAEGNRHTFSIYDMANKVAPVLLTRVTIPAGGYVHNIWPTADRNYVVTTEETAGKTMKLWDISDMGNVQLTSQFIAPSNLAHNAHVEGDRIFVSHYESGAVAFDISNPAAPQLVSQFDTWGNETPNYNGNWGIFPHTGNGMVYVSNMDGHFYILNRTSVSSAGSSMFGDSVSGVPNTNVVVDINVTNTEPVHSLIIPLEWSGPLNLSLVGISKAGTRTAAFLDEGYVALDLANKKLVYMLTSSSNGSVPDMPPGTGPVLRVTLKIPAGATGGPNPISVGPVNGFNATLTTDCVDYAVAQIPGEVKLFTPSGCCVGTVGNVDNSPDQNVDVADLTKLIDILFISLGPLPCSDEANVDGSPGGSIDVGDLTALISLMFINIGAPFNACP